MIALAALLVRQTQATIYAAGIKVARAIGLPVDTWQPGDPTRAQFYAQAELLEGWEAVVAGFIASGFLDFAKDTPWLDVCAKQFFNVDVPPATYARTEVELTNNGAGFFEGIEAGDLTFRSISGKTYRNITGGNLNSGPGTKLTVTVEAEEAGAESSAGPGEINELVTGYIDVSCSNPAGAVGTDKQAPEVTVQQCRDKIDSWSPNGPRGVYRFVARDPKKAGTNAVSRVRVHDSSDTGDVKVYLAGPSGGVSEDVRALVEAAILRWATPLCITPTVRSATVVEVPIAYQVWVYKGVNKTHDEVKSAVGKSLAKMFSEREIGGDVIPPHDGILAKSLIEAAIRTTFPEVFRVVVTQPAADVVLDEGEVAVALVDEASVVNLVVDA